MLGPFIGGKDPERFRRGSIDFWVWLFPGADMAKGKGSDRRPGEAVLDA